MPEVSCKTEIHNFEKQQVKITFTDGKSLLFVDFDSFEVFAKMIYANYKKYYYIFNKGFKHGVESNTS